MSCDDTHPLDSVRLDWVWDGRLRAQGYTEHDLATTARVLSRVCPKCRADIGAWCRTAGGNVLAHLDLQHATRRIFG
ncbi:MAG: zinc finger domain-containing protein [Actinopolymorphaceae bacterium]